MTKQPIFRFVVVALAAAAVVAIVVVMPTLSARQQSVSTGQYISGPSEWVPLTYEWQDRIGGVVNHTYVEYRSATGSTRRERGDGHEIQIVDMPSRSYFVFDHKGWRQHPLREQKGSGKPFAELKRSAVTPVPTTDPRVKLIVGLGIPVSFYEMPIRVVGGGVIGSLIYCPELNMLEVWERRTRKDGVVEKIFTHFALGEPPVDWAPPVGVTVTRNPQAAGPGRTSPPQQTVEIRP